MLGAWNTVVPPPPQVSLFIEVETFFCAFYLKFVLFIIFMTVYILIKKITLIQHRPTKSPKCEMSLSHCPLATILLHTPVAAGLPLWSGSICRPYMCIPCMLGLHTLKKKCFKVSSASSVAPRLPAPENRSHILHRLSQPDTPLFFSLLQE